LVHSLSSISLAQLGHYDEAMAALRHAERLAAMVHADDVLATVCGNQANVMMMQHRYEQALALAERSVSLHEAHGSGHGLAVALATLGQICVRLGDLGRAENALHRALEVRSPIQFHETTGAVFDTLAQIHLIRGRYDTAPAAWGEYLRLRGAVHAKCNSAVDAYHDFSQSATLLDLLGARYQSGLSHLALGRLVAETGARSVAERHLTKALGIFQLLGAERDLDDTRAAQALLTTIGTGQYVISPADADDAIVRRIVDAAALPDLLGRET